MEYGFVPSATILNMSHALIAIEIIKVEEVPIGRVEGEATRDVFCFRFLRCCLDGVTFSDAISVSRSKSLLFD